MIKSLFSPLLALTLLAVVSVAQSAQAQWSTDYEAALKQARESNKPILVDFTGSDWCGWCIKLDKETFEKPEFTSFAKDNLVLLEVDFPNSKPQSDAVKKQNEALQSKFKVEGFPTLVLIDGEGKEIARNVGYLAGGPEAMIAWIKKETSKK